MFLIEEKSKLRGEETLNCAFQEISKLERIGSSPKAKRLLWQFLHDSYGMPAPTTIDPDLGIYVNAQSRTYGGEPNNMAGGLQFAPVTIRKNKKGAYKVRQEVPPEGGKTIEAANSDILFDSGAFPEVRTNSRVSYEAALNRQLRQIQSLPNTPRKSLIVSYDRLIDEKYVDGDRRKERWSREEGAIAVADTVAAAKYLPRESGA